MGNGWLSYAVMPMICGRGPRLQPKDQNSECGSRVLFDAQGIDSCDGKTQRLLEDSFPKCALNTLECNEKYVKPQCPRHILKFELARLGD